MISRGWLAAGAIAVLIATAGISYWQGHKSGEAACQARHNAEALARIEAGRKLNEDRIRLARERDELARKLREEAYADPVVVQRCLGPDRVRRLNAVD